jgi:hypothetical protein
VKSICRYALSRCDENPPNPPLAACFTAPPAIFDLYAASELSCVAPEFAEAHGTRRPCRGMLACMGSGTWRGGRVCGAVACLVALGIVALPAAAVGRAAGTGPWVVAPTPARSTARQLHGVACWSATRCVAVGATALAEVWDGNAWRLSPSSSHGNASSVACTSASHCVAVGFSSGSTSDRTFVEMWNGASWHAQPSPNRGPHDNFLTGVACTSASSCTAVGSATSSSYVESTLAERWDGAKWSVIATPSPGSNATLSRVACWSSSGCIAVGSHNTDDLVTPLIERWDGSRWSILANASTAQTGWLRSVACVSKTRCIAVGTTQIADGTTHTLTESWDGAHWRITSSPNVSSEMNELNDVTCTAAATCTAVGFDGLSGGRTSRTLIESLQGTTWAVVGSPDPGSVANELDGVACGGARCHAVGDASNVSGSPTALALHTR